MFFALAPCTVCLFLLLFPSFHQDVFLPQIVSVQHPREADSEGIAEKPPAAVRIQAHCGVSGRSATLKTSVQNEGEQKQGFLSSSQGAVFNPVLLILSLDCFSLSVPKSI